MQEYELQTYIDNIKYIDVNSWEQTRILMYMIAQVNSRKHLELKDIMTLPWDNNQKNTEISTGEIERLKQQQKLISEQLKNNGK